MKKNSKKLVSILSASIIGISSCSNNSKPKQYYTFATTTSENITSDDIIDGSTTEQMEIFEDTTTYLDTESITETYESTTQGDAATSKSNDIITSAAVYDTQITTTIFDEPVQEITTVSTTVSDTLTSDTTTFYSETTTSQDNTTYDTIETTSIEEVTTLDTSITTIEQEEIVEVLDEDELIVALEDYEVIIMNEALNGNKESLKQKLDEYFTATVGFIFCDEPIKGKRLSELSDSAKVKILSITDNINDTIEEYYPDYKITIKDKFNNVKEWTKDKFKAAGSVLRDEVIGTIGQDKFDSIKTNYEKTKSLIKDLGSKAIDGIKDLAGKGIEKIKHWYYNKTN